VTRRRRSASRFGSGLPSGPPTGVRRR
jgi:hypothetical protein